MIMLSVLVDPCDAIICIISIYLFIYLFIFIYVFIYFICILNP